MEERDTYKYHLKLGNKIIDKAVTRDLERREVAHQEEFPGSRVVQVGRRTTMEEALRWESREKGIKRILIRKPQIESIKPKTDYREIIQVNVPIRFYWNSDKTFDGIEFGPFNKDLMPWELDMMNQCLGAIKPAMGEKDDEDTDNEAVSG